MIGNLFEKKFNSLVPEVSLEYPNDDYKKSKHLGQYRLSEAAIYKADGSYIPFEAVKDCIHDQTSVHVSGCCAGGVPVERIVFITDSVKIPLIFDSSKQVENVLNKLKR